MTDDQDDFEQDYEETTQNESCVEDRDCPGPLELCYYVEYPWVAKLGDQNVCGCNNWFGYRGVNCDEFGLGSYIFMASTLISGVVGVYGLILTLRTLFVLFNFRPCKSSDKNNNFKNGLSRISSREAEPRDGFNGDSTFLNDRTQLLNTKGSIDLSEYETPSSRPPTKKASAVRKVQNERSSGGPMGRKRQRMFNSLNFTALQVFFAFLTYLTWRVALFTLLFLPEDVILRDEATIEGKSRAHFIEEKIEKNLVIIIGVFFALSTLNLSLVWIDNVKKIKKLSAATEDRLLRYKKFLFVVNIAWIVCSIFLEPAIMGGFIILFMIGATISYFVAERKLKKLYQSLYKTYPTNKMLFRKGGIDMDTATTDSKSYWLEVLLRRMVRTKRRITISAVISVAGAAVYMALSIVKTWREYSPNGEVSIPMIGNEVMSFGIGLNLLAVAAFLYTTAVAPLKSRKSTNR